MTRVLVLTDGVPGHERASAGILTALSRHRNVEAVWVAMREVRPRSRRIARLTAAFAAPDRWLAHNARLGDGDGDGDGAGGPRTANEPRALPDRVEIVVSTGPSTAAANIALARRFGARNIYCGFAKWPVIGFDALLSPVPSRARATILTPRPSDIDAEALPEPRPLRGSGPRRLALLFGGESKHYSYSAQDMAALSAGLAAQLRADPDWSLVAFDSRRTAAPLFDAFAAALSGFGERARIVRFAEGGIASNAEAFRADLAIVTADSLSMITEAIAAARPTLVARADAYSGPSRDRREIAALAAQGLIGRATFPSIDRAALESVPLPPRVSQPEVLSVRLQARGF